jgi:carbamate kinase
MNWLRWGDRDWNYDLSRILMWLEQVSISELRKKAHRYLIFDDQNQEIQITSESLEELIRKRRKRVCASTNSPQIKTDGILRKGHENN